MIILGHANKILCCSGGNNLTEGCVAMVTTVLIGNISQSCSQLIKAIQNNCRFRSSLFKEAN